MRGLINRILSWSISLGFLLIYFIGIWHGYTRHKLDLYWVGLPPTGLYYGGEYFLHDDYAGIDWEKQTSDDLNIIVKFSEREATGMNNMQDLEFWQSFINKVHSYPKKRLDTIKFYYETYISYNNTIVIDIKEYLSSIVSLRDLKTTNIASIKAKKLALILDHKNSPYTKIDSSLITNINETLIKLSADTPNDIVLPKETIIKKVSEVGTKEFTTNGKIFTQLFGESPSPVL